LTIIRLLILSKKPIFITHCNLCYFSRPIMSALSLGFTLQFYHLLVMAAGAQPRFQSWGDQFLGLGYCTEQNTDGIPSFVDCSLLRNRSHILYQKSCGGPSKFWGVQTPRPPVAAPLYGRIAVLRRPSRCAYCYRPSSVVCRSVGLSQ